MSSIKKFNSEKDIKEHFEKTKNQFRLEKKKKETEKRIKVGKVVCRRPSAICDSSLNLEFKLAINHFIGQISTMVVSGIPSLQKGTFPPNFVARLDNIFEGLGKLVLKRKFEIDNSNVSPSFKTAINKILK